MISKTLTGLALAASISLFSAQVAHAVSVGELISNCGDDGERYCAGVGYGDPMQQCLEANYSNLEPKCKVIIDRIRGGESVTLF